MNRAKAKVAARNRRRARIKGKVTGTADRPRLSVGRSLRHIYAQIIDDEAGGTLAAASSLSREIREEIKSGANIEGARVVGGLIAKKAMENNIRKVVFDRGGRLYHGRVKALAEGARKAGLEF
ncbi:MAG: 50S ribosomal protein L18 [Candidatus Hydrogenedentes bacterium]|nr:50S ribosomal protein L18 [Candidatus Hydrogenedentota bacterium]